MTHEQTTGMEVEVPGDPVLSSEDASYGSSQADTMRHAMTASPHPASLSLATHGYAHGPLRCSALRAASE